MLKFKLNPASLGDTMNQTDTSFEMTINCAISQTSVKNWLNLNKNIETLLPGYMQLATTRTQNLYKRTTTLLFRKHTLSKTSFYRTLFQVVHKETGESLFPTEPNAVLIFTITPGENRLHANIHMAMHYRRNHPEPEQFIQILKVLARNITTNLNDH